MSADTAADLVLESLRDVPVVGETAPFYQQKCMVCLDNQGHGSGVRLNVRSDNASVFFRILWSTEVTEQMRRSHADLQEAVQFAACGITFLTIPRIKQGLTAIQQAVRGTSFDYYLAPEDQDDRLIFNNVVRLEISGILRENEGNRVEDRARDRLRRFKRTPEALPALVSVVEFGQPWSRVVEA